MGPSDWDPEKNRRNQEKHGLTFSHAIRVFDSSRECLELFDERHSEREERFITLGPIQGRIVVVVWTERPGGVTRIISARWATPQERRLYHRHMESLQ